MALQYSQYTLLYNCGYSERPSSTLIHVNFEVCLDICTELYMTSICAATGSWHTRMCATSQDHRESCVCVCVCGLALSREQCGLTDTQALPLSSAGQTDCLLVTTGLFVSRVPGPTISFQRNQLHSCYYLINPLQLEIRLNNI